jgi:hypothetical protein
MAVQKRQTLAPSIDNGRKAASATDGADNTDSLRRSANEVNPVQTSVTDQTNGSSAPQRRRDLRPGIGDASPRDGGGPGRAV